jgi:hypothetical protein
MPEDQDLAIERVHRVEGLLQPPLPLGADHGDAGPGVAAQKLRRQRHRGDLGKGAVQQLYLAIGVPRLDPQMLPVHELERHPRQPAEPEEHRLFGPLQVFGQGLGRLEEHLLEHVRRVDPAPQPLVQTQRDHPPQPIAMRGQELRPGRLVPAHRPPRRSPLVRLLARRFAGRAHKSIDCAREPIGDRKNHGDRAEGQIRAKP